MAAPELKTLKYHIFLKKPLGISIVSSKRGHEYKKTFKEEKSIEILKIIGSVTNIEEYQNVYNH